MGGTHIVYAVTLHSHTLLQILQQCARYYPAILSSRKLSFRIFLGCSCLALFAAAAAAYPAQNCADRHRQTCHRHYRTQCRLELSFRDPPNNQPDHTCLCVITCVFTRAGLMGLSRTTLQRTLGPCQMVEQRCSINCPPEFIFR